MRKPKHVVRISIAVTKEQYDRLLDAAQREPLSRYIKRITLGEEVTRGKTSPAK